MPQNHWHMPVTCGIWHFDHYPPSFLDSQKSRFTSFLAFQLGNIKKSLKKGSKSLFFKLALPDITLQTFIIPDSWGTGISEKIFANVLAFYLTV